MATQSGGNKGNSGNSGNTGNSGSRNQGTGFSGRGIDSDEELNEDRGMSSQPGNKGGTQQGGTQQGGRTGSNEGTKKGGMNH